MSNPARVRTVIGAGRIFGADPAASSLSVVDGRIGGWGNDAAAAEPFDLGRFGVARTLVAPAFVDAHLHTVQAGLVTRGLDLHGVASRAELLDRLAAHVRARPDAEIVVGQGWDDRYWPDPNPPTRTELDRAGDGRMIYLARVDVHSAVVSTALLEELPHVASAPGFSADGLVRREAHHLCRGALDRFFPDEERRAAARATLDRCLALGVGAVHDLGGPHLGPMADWLRVREIAAELGLGAVGYWGELAAPETITRARENGLGGLAGDLCIDGAIGSRTASLNENYADDPSRGVRYLGDDEIRDHVAACTRAGLQAGFHCIGDDGVQAAVQGLRRAAEITGVEAMRASRHRLEHVEMVAADDIATLARLDVVASVQPGFDAAWGSPAELYETRLGADRSSRMNPFGDLQRAGVTMGFGTDAPVTPLAGWQMVWQAVRHSRPEQQLSLSDAFGAATTGGHRAARDDRTGVIAPGRPVSLAVWDVSDFELDPAGLPLPEPDREPTCLALLLGDRVVARGRGDSIAVERPNLEPPAPPG